MPDLCHRCGACCRVISLEHTKSELKALAEHERRRLARRPDHPHAEGMRRLIRDIAFIARHFRRIHRRHAIELNPRMADSAFDGRLFYVCDALGKHGLCTLHAERPFICEGYPWYHGQARASLLVVQPCGYERALELAGDTNESSSRSPTKTSARVGIR